MALRFLQGKGRSMPLPRNGLFLPVNLSGSILEDGKMMPFYRDITGLKFLFKYTGFGQGFIGQSYPFLVWQDRGNPNRQIPAGVKSHVIDLGQFELAFAVSGVPAEPLGIQFKPGTGIAPEIPRGGQCEQGDQCHDPPGGIKAQDAKRQHGVDTTQRDSRPVGPALPGEAKNLLAHRPPVTSSVVPVT